MTPYRVLALLHLICFWQVRFTVLEDCLPLPEEKFKKVIKDNYFSRNKFDCQLTSEQVLLLFTIEILIVKQNMSEQDQDV